ncbi:hypothetical protein MICA_914 [Micavibrio aeruginosavorus ARL-13]|uniref:Uncharacterized protein n=1 Tax=Micavibrio aeruginosavorus (strain ARL-13) TaxID=856793 RepID=G2KSG2_MICAA|nr:hypothetical protein MICA_914 [Micavibrio aeruginosavorus ARL-13]
MVGFIVLGTTAIEHSNILKINDYSSRSKTVHDSRKTPPRGSGFGPFSAIKSSSTHMMKIRI